MSYFRDENRENPEKNNWLLAERYEEFRKECPNCLDCGGRLYAPDITTDKLLGFLLPHGRLTIYQCGTKLYFLTQEPMKMEDGLGFAYNARTYNDVLVIAALALEITT